MQVSIVALLAVLLLQPVFAAAKESRLQVPVDGRTLEARLFTPRICEPAPAVLVLHTGGGLQEADLAYASALAEAGFVSLVVA